MFCFYTLDDQSFALKRLARYWVMLPRFFCPIPNRRVYAAQPLLAISMASIPAS